MRLIHISIDVREASRGLLHTRVELPVEPGSIAIFTTPLWIQESHRNNGPVAGIAGLYFRYKTRALTWRRNPLCPSEYLVQVPLGVHVICASFDSVVTQKVTRRIVMLNWEHVLLYPARRDINTLRVQASVIVSTGWDTGTALLNHGQATVADTTDSAGHTLIYQPTSLAQLADSPVLTGAHFGQYALTADKTHILCVAADTEERADVPQDILDKLHDLIKQTVATFGPRHYDTFWFLVALTDHWPGPGGSEHHESCDITLPLKGLSDRENLEQNGPLLAHEFVHSWNGKFRRPAGHLPNDFATPLDSRLLWVYEGLTQYYEGVLAVRAGVSSLEFYLAELARTVAWLQGQTGRLWRSTEDTCTGTSLRGGEAWANWTRGGLDYYHEGILLWLDVDTRMQSITGGKLSLDDFARTFFGGTGTPAAPTVVPYTLENIVSGLNAIVPFDSQGFFDAKVLAVTPAVNIDGIERSGYNFTSTAGDSDVYEDLGAGINRQRKTIDAIWYSIGLRLGTDGLVVDVCRGSVADAAKLAPRQTIARVGELSFSIAALASEIGACKNAPESRIQLTVTQEGDVWPVELDYHVGLRYPRLERKAGTVDMVCHILKGRHE